MVHIENDANKEKKSATLRRKKIWILNHRKENPLISQNKIALDFSAKFKKTVDRTCVTKVLQKSDQLLAFSKADPELERKKKTKNITTITKVEVVPLTFVKKYALIFLLKSFVYPISHIFVRPKRVWLSGYVWLSGVWLSGDSTVFHFAS